jgi:predicted ABC-type ATPase
MSSEPIPKVILISGPNGAGKSTCAPSLLRGPFDVPHFVNADAIARGLSGFASELVALEAGRVMLTRLDALAAARESFAFETTLASRTFAPRMRTLMAAGYAFHLIYLWVVSPELSILRIQDRVRLGGHHVPDDTVRQRYRRGLRNFFTLHRPIATSWRLYDASRPTGPELVATAEGGAETIFRPELWSLINKEAGHVPT